MESYKMWVRQNRQLIAALESIANTATWFLPERFSSSEIGTEAVASLLGLVTTLNQFIIDTAPQHPRQDTPRKPQQSCLALAASLSAVKQLEVLIEVVAEHYKGREKKWNTLAAMEGLKASLRFLILHRNGYRMLLDGGETMRKEGSSQAQPGSSFRDKRKQSNMRSLKDDLEANATLAMSKFRENLGIKTTPSWANRFQSLPTSTSRTTAPCFPESCYSGSWELPEKLSVAGECMFIVRPLLYVLLIRHYGLRSWKPWLASLLLDVTGITSTLAAQIIKYKRLIDNSGDLEHLQLSTEEVQEFKRRQVLLLLYVVRDPFFRRYTRPCLDGLERGLKPVPLFGPLGGKVIDFLSDVQARYCYTSGS